MKQRALALLSSCLSFCVAGCGAPAQTEKFGESTEYLAGSTALGNIPAGLPARVMVGLFEDTGGSWMKNSGVRWDARYRYLTKGWVNNWGYGAYDGTFALNYFRESDAQGFVPAVQYYQIFSEAGGAESATLQKVQNAATMRSYFGDFKLLMQRAKDYGKPVMVLLEADAFGFLQQQSANNPNAPAAIAASGMAELAGLPNTVSGFGLAFLQLRKAVGASNALLGIHVSAWASGKDISSFSVTDPLQPEVDKVYAFLSPLGLSPNVTGQQLDLLVGDPLDRDADFYRLTQNQNRWWDASDTASISSRSFNRYAEWLRLWNVKAQKRWVLWQIPLGNSNSKNVYSHGGAAEGYKDNRPEYFFGGSTAHIAKFAESGVIGLLFGAGAGGQSSYTNDQYSDGQLFMKGRAGAVVNAGGVPLATVQSPPTAQYDFESSAQGWTGSGVASLVRSTDRAFTGSASLKVGLGNTAGDETIRVASPTVPAGSKVSFHIWLPPAANVSAVQPYALQGAAGGWAWSGNWQAASNLQAGAWNTLVVTVPTSAAPLAELGVIFSLSGASNATAYVDSVAY